MIEFYVNYARFLGGESEAFLSIVLLGWSMFLLFLCRQKNLARRWTDSIIAIAIALIVIGRFFHCERMILFRDCVNDGAGDYAYERVLFLHGLVDSIFYPCLIASLGIWLYLSENRNPSCAPS